MSTLDHDTVDIISLLCGEAHRNAQAHGFYKADGEIDTLLFTAERRDLIEFHLQNMAIKRHGLIGSEIGELTEAVRKPGPAAKIPGFTLEEEEAADAVIRLLDYAGWRKLRLGAAIVAKMAYNEGRPYLHGKLS